MKTDVNGCSTCPAGQERYEVHPANGRFLGYVQYDYRTHDGELFSVVRPTFMEARRARDTWIAGRLGDDFSNQRR